MVLNLFRLSYLFFCPSSWIRYGSVIVHNTYNPAIKNNGISKYLQFRPNKNPTMTKRLGRRKKVVFSFGSWEVILTFWAFFFTSIMTGSPFPTISLFTHYLFLLFSSCLTSDNSIRCEMLWNQYLDVLYCSCCLLPNSQLASLSG